MLFEQISWQTFLGVAGVLTILWYLIVWYLYYRKKSTASPDSLPHRWSASVDNLVDDDLMGVAKEEAGAKLVEAEEFGFGDADKLGQLGPVADFQREISLTSRQLEAEMAGKQQVLERYRAVVARHQLSAERNASLREFLRDSSATFLEDDDLDAIGL